MENMITKYFVMDLHTTEQCASLEDAEETAAWWMSCGCVDDADNETILRWANSPDAGLDSGDIWIFEVERTETEWDVLNVGNTDEKFCRLAVDGFEPVKVLSGKAHIIEEARKRGLI